MRDGVCKDATDKQCSQLCQTAFKELNKVYGCCLFSYIALDTNVTYSNHLWGQCGVDNPGLCDGGISNAPISTPGSEAKGAALGTVFSSIFLLIPALLLVLL